MLLGASALGHFPIGAGLAEAISRFDVSVAETLHAIAAQSIYTPSSGGGGFGNGPLGSFAVGELPIGGYRTTAAGGITFNLSVIEAATITTSISFVRGYPHRSIRFMTPSHRGPRSRR